MKLVSVTIKDFRSITTANRLPFTEFSVLLGPNNEGKSNILAAVVLALALLAQGDYVYRRQSLRYRYSENIGSYDWDRDYPVACQTSRPSGKSQVTLEFELDASERKRFRSRVGINLKSNLRVKVDLGQDDAKVDLILSGPVKSTLTQRHINAIARFVADSVYLQYIPAVRTAEMAQEVIDGLLSARLRQLEKDPKYQSHIVALQKLQQPVLQALSKELTSTVQGFLPDVNAIAITNHRSLARAISRSTNIDVDDGTKTSLGLKGDGIKSLTAISLMRHLGKSKLGSRSLILAIEEPESHLHPKAIHRLKDVLKEMASESQVILTTHCAAMVDRSAIERNILVRSGSAAPAGSILELREALGVEQSDNLSSARLILLLEGPNDVGLVKTWLLETSETLRKAIDAGLVGFDSLDGVGNLTYKARTHKANVSDVYAFVDNDRAAKEAIAAAEKSGAILLSEYTATVCPGLANTEIQDLIAEVSYLDDISELLGVSITSSDLNKIKGEWSARIKHAVEQKGKSWSSGLESRLKAIACTCAEKLGASSLSSKRRSSFDALVNALEAKVLAYGR